MEAKRILVVLAHPDDEVFPMSGTLARYIHEGSRVTYVCLTLGEMGRNLGNPPFANRVTLPSVRRKELEKSCSIIGIQDLRMWGYHDKTIEFEPHEPLDQRITDVIEEIKPEIIFTNYPGYGVHPDHNACGAAVIRAAAKIPPAERPVVMCAAFPTGNDLGAPDVVNDVSAFVEQKIGTLKAHSSQFKFFEMELEGTKTGGPMMKRLATEQFWLYPFEDKE